MKKHKNYIFLATQMKKIMYALFFFLTMNASLKSCDYILNHAKRLHFKLVTLPKKQTLKALMPLYSGWSIDEGSSEVGQARCLQLYNKLSDCYLDIEKGVGCTVVAATLKSGLKNIPDSNDIKEQLADIIEVVAKKAPPKPSWMQ